MLRSTPPGEDGILKGDAFDRARRAQTEPYEAREEGAPPPVDWLKLVREAEKQGLDYSQQQNRSAWNRTYKAYRNEHFAGSKYTSAEWRNRSKIFRPKTRTAVRKDRAAAMASLFSTVDAITCSPGNESDPVQRAGARLVAEILNYRTDRTSGRAAIPWFRVAAGAREDALLAGICVSKQYWKLETRTETRLQNATDEFGQPIQIEAEVQVPIVNRPDCLPIPVENIVIDPAASWLDPIQSAAYFMAKYPMRISEIKRMQSHPTNPWKNVDVSKLRGAGQEQSMNAQGVRMAREGAPDRFSRVQTGTGEFEVFWVYEVFLRVSGQEDMTFWCAGGQALLTDPTPTEEVYPAHGGERPYVFGVGSLEAHQLFPMAPAESWQQTQIEINDLANLRLDQVKQGVSPIAKVVRGRQIDLKSIQRRGPNSIVLVQNKDDIEWDRPPDVPSSAYAEMERLNIDFDDLAGQFNSGSVQTNRSLNETVGGMRLIAGSANAVQEFDLRTWIETWCEPVIGQLVKLIQYYEDDATILALCGEKAELFQKFGVDRITDDLLSQQVTVRVNVGLGTGDPQQRIGKFANAISVLQPILQGHPDLQSGKRKIDLDAVVEEVFGLAGYRDGGKRFIKEGEPTPPPPTAEAEMRKLQAETAQKEADAAKKQAEVGLTRAKTQATVSDIAMNRAQMIDDMHARRAGLARETFNDIKGHRAAAEDREMRRESAKGRQQPAGDETAAMLQQIIAMLGQLLQGQGPGVP
jgi:hypothetical protein